MKLTILIILALFILTGCEGRIINATVPTASMEPTISMGARIRGDRQAFNNTLPERFDIIIFRYNMDDSIMHVSRIFGLPGETLEIIGGRVYIDGEFLEDDFAEDNFGSYGPFVIPRNSYFVMSDNRRNSLDSRQWVDPYVHFNDIVAKVNHISNP